MEYEKFIKTLKENGLTLKKFSELSGIKYDTCSKWGKNNRPVSDWAESWLNLYIENKEYKDLKNILNKALGNTNLKDSRLEVLIKDYKKAYIIHLDNLTSKTLEGLEDSEEEIKNYLNNDAADVVFSSVKEILSDYSSGFLSHKDRVFSLIDLLKK